MRFELDDFSDATIQADVHQVADFDFAAELGGAVHAVFLSWLFSQCTRSPRCISENFRIAHRLTEVYTAHQRGSRPPSMRQSLSRPMLCSDWLLKSGGFRRVSVSPGWSEQVLATNLQLFLVFLQASFVDIFNPLVLIICNLVVF